ncbi:MAG: hypothetical protein PHF86_05815 [Candidatus Nanoarchaeia archaeon]|nr:hypothetical protein [Candidatus Nanoarchaeia archaeon]
MNKRGQVTTFMIVGFVLLVIFVLIFFLRDYLFETVRGVEGTKIILNSKLDEINFKVNDCIKTESTKALDLIGKQGGSVQLLNYIEYYDMKINYLCFGIPNTKKCENMGLSITELNNELTSYLEPRIKSCISMESFRDDSRYDFNIGDYTFNVNVLDKNILFNISYPITLKRKDVEVSVSSFSENLDIPLGKIQESVVDILNAESNGNFDNVLYTLSKNNDIIVIVKRPYPDKIYTVKYKDSSYEFNFAIKGNE